MIDQEKLKTMTQLALYEKNKGKKDFIAHSYEKEDYIRFQALKTGILVVMAFVIIVGIVVLWNMDALISNFDVLDYKLLIGAMVAVFAGLLAFYIFISCRQSGEEHNQAVPRVRRYQRGLKKMKEFYRIEDKQQRDFEKGEWRNG